MGTIPDESPNRDARCLGTCVCGGVWGCFGVTPAEKQKKEKRYSKKQIK